MRDAWLKGRSGYVCSYCGQSLGIDQIWIGDGMLSVKRGWRVRGGELVFLRPHRRAATRPRGGMIEDQDQIAVPSPTIIVCRNIDCGERLLLPTDHRTV